MCGQTTCLNKSSTIVKTLFPAGYYGNGIRLAEDVAVRPDRPATHNQR
jgi:hypothetical protein